MGELAFAVVDLILAAHAQLFESIDDLIRLRPVPVGKRDEYLPAHMSPVSGIKLISHSPIVTFNFIHPILTHFTHFFHIPTHFSEILFIVCTIIVNNIIETEGCRKVCHCSCYKWVYFSILSCQQTNKV